MASREERLDRALRSFQEQAAKAAQLKEKLGELRGQGGSPDGSVSVTVAPSGAVLGLRLSPQAMRKTHVQLQQDIMAAIRQATQQAAARMQETVRPLLGERTEQFQQALNAHVPALAPAAPEQPAPQAPSPPEPPVPTRTPRNRQPAPEVEPDDFGGPILRRD
ncbi:YbaB/EbfC family nucleoid-associated protein [Amycolatopsis dongchuanensis]|uniref:YbaB/EbfC DNA-binding family protein n=1 Tax=Amycolatopsis dongchuanensis TaxID=1070866 RepID=A0ABP9R3T8_9PSEU